MNPAYLDKEEVEDILNPANRELMRTDHIAIHGMTSDECVRKIEGALSKHTGVESVHVDREKEIATVTYDSRRTNISAIHDALLKSGYKPTARFAE